MTRGLGPDAPTFAVALGDQVVLPRSWASFSRTLTQDSPKNARLCTARVYERMDQLGIFALMKADDAFVDLSDAELDILRDALLDGRYDVARELTRGCAGVWRPSTSRISLIDQGRNQYIIDQIQATSMWFVDLDCGAPPNSGYDLRVWNDTDREIVYRADLLLKVM